MKASDLVNVLHHIPGETEVEDIAIKVEQGVIYAVDALENLIEGKDFHHGATPVESTKKSDI